MVTEHYLFVYLERSIVFSPVALYSYINTSFPHRNIKRKKLPLCFRKQNDQPMKKAPVSSWIAIFRERQKRRLKPHVWEISTLFPETAKKLYFHEFHFCSLSYLPKGRHISLQRRTNSTMLLPRGQILGRNLGNSLESFPPCQSPLQLCLEISISSNSLQAHWVQLLYTVETGGKPDRKPNPLPYGLRNSDRNLKSENSQGYAQKPQRNCTGMNLASGKGFRRTRQDCILSLIHLYSLRSL